MDQMQTTMLYMLQTVTAAQTAKETTRTETGEFRSLLEKQQKVSEQPESAETVEAKAELSVKEEEPLDEAAMQELAAMQLFVADTMQIVTVAEEDVTGIESVMLTVETAEQMQQTILPETAELNNGVTEVTAEQIPVMEQAVAEEAEFTAEKPVVETVETSAEAPVETEDAVQVKTAEGAEQKRSDAETETDHSKDSPVEDMQVNGENRERFMFREVETAPVKVSDVAAEAEDVNMQISDKLSETLAKGETKVELQLNPDHLGKITIELTKSSDGTLHVSLLAENSQTRLMLERDMSSLQSALNQSVRQDVQVEVSQQQEAREQSYEGHHQQSDREQEQQQRKQSGEDFLNQLRLGLIPTDEAAS